MKMPKSIKLFEQLFLTSLVLGVIQSALLLQQSSPLLNETELNDTISGVIMLQALIVIIIGTLVLLTSRKKSAICKWIITVIFVIGMIAFIPILAAIADTAISSLIISILQIAMQGYAVYLLFNSDSKKWFESKK